MEYLNWVGHCTEEPRGSLGANWLNAELQYKPIIIVDTFGKVDCCFSAKFGTTMESLIKNWNY